MRYMLLSCLVLFSVPAQSYTGDGMPFKYISSCEIDINGDGKSDKALLLEGLNGRELIALIAKQKGYDAFVVSTGRENVFLSCRTGTEVKETVAASGKGKIFKAPGAYLELVKPESSSVAFIWNKNMFQEVWTSD